MCRPGTGLYNVGLPGDRMPAKSAEPRRTDGAATVGDAADEPWPGYHPIPVGRHCNWTAPIVTTIPDSHSRACTAPLPDGRIFMIGAQIPSGRDPIVLSISKDGLDWSEAWAVRNCVDASCKPRFGGPPGAFWAFVSVVFNRKQRMCANHGPCIKGPLFLHFVRTELKGEWPRLPISGGDVEAGRAKRAGDHL